MTIGDGATPSTRESAAGCGGAVGDQDGVPDARDTCPEAANPRQADTGGNGVGNACAVPAEEQAADAPKRQASG